MSPIRACDEERMLDNSYYAVSTVAPCITIPLSLAVVVIPGCWWLLWSERKKTSASMMWLCSGELFIQTVFTMCCWAQCIAMVHADKFAGGTPLCEFQGWYVGFYVFSETIMAGGLNLAMNTPFTASQGAAIAASAIAIGALLAALPFMGVSHYIFGSVFCSVDLEDPVYGVIFVLVFVGMVACVAAGPVQILAQRRELPVKLRRICLGAAVVTIGGWSAALIIACAGLIRGSSCEQSFDSKVGLMWGIYATLAHLQNLVNPVLFCVCMRRSLPQLQVPSAVELTKAATNGAALPVALVPSTAPEEECP
jgi:hypothetical protein